MSMPSDSFLKKKTGSLKKFGPKSGFLKHSLSTPDHVPAICVKSCENKKVPFSHINISLLPVFDFFWGQKMDFWPVLWFWPQRKNGRFTVPSLRFGSVVSQGHFFGDPDHLTEFHGEFLKNKGTWPQALTRAQKVNSRVEREIWNSDLEFRV